MNQGTRHPSILKTNDKQYIPLRNIRAVRWTRCSKLELVRSAGRRHEDSNDSEIILSSKQHIARAAGVKIMETLYSHVSLDTCYPLDEKPQAKIYVEGLTVLSTASCQLMSTYY